MTFLLGGVVTDPPEYPDIPEEPEKPLTPLHPLSLPVSQKSTSWRLKNFLLQRQFDLVDLCNHQGFP